MTNPELLKEVQVLSSCLGYDAHFTGTQLRFSWNAHNSKSHRKFPAEALLRQVDSVKMMNYAGSHSYFRHHNNHAKAKKGIPPSQYVAENIITANSSNPSPYRYDTITSIEVLDSVETTYTMCVDDDLHQFVADGVIHKNTAMWWTRQAMVRCQAQLDEWRKRDGFDGRMTLQIHDEIVFDFPKHGDPIAENARAKAVNGKGTFRTSNLWRVRALQQLMVRGGDDLGFPSPVGIEYNPVNWSEGVTL